MHQTGPTCTGITCRKNPHLLQPRDIRSTQQQRCLDKSRVKTHPSHTHKPPIRGTTYLQVSLTMMDLLSSVIEQPLH